MLYNKQHNYMYYNIEPMLMLLFSNHINYYNIFIFY